jgi:hypothetical protein
MRFVIVGEKHSTMKTYGGVEVLLTSAVGIVVLLREESRPVPIV